MTRSLSAIAGVPRVRLHHAIPLFAAVITLLPCLASAANRSAGVTTSLTVQIIANDKRLAVTQMLAIGAHDGQGSTGSWAFPMLVPESGPQPSMDRRSESNQDGIDVQTGSGTRISFGPQTLTIEGDPSRPGGIRAQVRYTIPVTAQSLVFHMRPALDLDSLQFVTRRSSNYGIHLRPLIPYSYREDVEEDGTWQYMNAIRGVSSGSPVRVQTSHLPSPFHGYRLAGIIAMCIAAGIVLVGVVSKRHGNRRS